MNIADSNDSKESNVRKSGLLSLWITLPITAPWRSDIDASTSSSKPHSIFIDSVALRDASSIVLPSAPLTMNASFRPQLKPFETDEPTSARCNERRRQKEKQRDVVWRDKKSAVLINTDNRRTSFWTLFRSTIMPSMH